MIINSMSPSPKFFDVDVIENENFGTVLESNSYILSSI